jgi:hypothetical protein
MPAIVNRGSSESSYMKGPQAGEQSTALTVRSWY